jgi:hypothetical protein
MSTTREIHRERIERIRGFLRGFDEGALTEAETEMLMLDSLLKPYVEQASQGKKVEFGGAWCGDKPPPPKRAVVELGANIIRFYPLSWTAPGGG